MLRLAIIGAGRIGQVHAKTIAAHPGAELVLITDPVAGAAAMVAEQYGVRSSEDAEQAYAAGDVDAATADLEAHLAGAEVAIRQAMGQVRPTP